MNTLTLTNRSRSAGVAGFTLVELLVVISIIAVLAALTIPVINAARRTAANGVIVYELKTNLEQALQQYKDKFGEYPPDGTDQAAIDRHIHKVFPRYAGTVTPTAGSGSTGLNPFTSLTFWLGGIWDDTNKRFIGFSADPTNPFDLGLTTPNSSRIGPFLDLDLTRTDQVAVGTVTIGTGAGTSTTKFLRLLAARGHGRPDRRLHRLLPGRERQLSCSRPRPAYSEVVCGSRRSRRQSLRRTGFTV